MVVEKWDNILGKKCGLWKWWLLIQRLKQLKNLNLSFQIKIIGTDKTIQ